MKSSELKVGVVYAYRESKYHPPRPVKVIDVSSTWIRLATSVHPVGTEVYRKGRDKRCTGNWGFPALGCKSWFSVIDKDQVLSDIAQTTVTPEQMLPLVKGGPKLTLPEMVMIETINPRFIEGEWSQVVESREVDEEIRAALSAEAKAESDQRVAEASRRVDALRALNLPGSIASPSEERVSNYRSSDKDWSADRYSGNTNRVVLTMAQIDALLALIPEGAQHEEPTNIDDDGWSYVERDGIKG